MSPPSCRNKFTLSLIIVVLSCVCLGLFYCEMTQEKYVPLYSVVVPMTRIDTGDCEDRFRDCGQMSEASPVRLDECRQTRDLCLRMAKIKG